MSKKIKKLRHIPNGIILGFDEVNNGFNLPNLNPHHRPSIIGVGYMMPDTGRACYGSQPFEKKGSIFSQGKNGLDRALRRGRTYLSEHPDFLYTTIPKIMVEKSPLCLIKGNAIAALTFAFFLKYNLNPSKTQVIFDGVDREVHSNHLESVLEMWFKKADLNVPHLYKPHADDRVCAVRKADRIAYYLAGISFLGNKHKWPYRHRKIDMKRLDELAIRVAERDLVEYPEP